MSKKCSIDVCSRLSRGFCQCCGREICLFHLNEHNEVLNQQLYNLSESINQLLHRIQTGDFRKIANIHRDTLEKWRAESHRRIDQFFLQKSQEIDRLIEDKIDEHQDDLNQLQNQVRYLLNTQETSRQSISHLANSVDHIERQIFQMDQEFLQLHLQPLTIDNQLIEIKGVNESNDQLLNISEVYKIISVPQGSYTVLSANQQSLLIHQAPNLCLVDRNLMIHKEIVWRHGMIYDLCWSETLRKFILIAEKNLYLLDPIDMSIKSVDLEKQKWFACTCSDEFLFLSARKWFSTITKISLRLPKPFGKQWESPNICQHDEYIDTIAYQNQTLAIAIRNKTAKKVRLDLASAETLEILWSVPLDISWNPTDPVHCATFIHQDWLISDPTDARLIHVTSRGTIKSITNINKNPLCLSIFGANQMAISVKDGIHFHRLTNRQNLTISLV